MTILLYAVIVLVGLAVGSFLNVVGLRYQPTRFLLGSHVLGGRSRCMNCERTLAWYELIPVASYVYLRGKCHTCAHPLSVQYPLVELLSALTLLAVPLYFASLYNVTFFAVNGGPLSWYYLLSAIWVLAILALILLSVIDYRQRIIPDEIVLFLAVLGLAKIAALSFYGQIFPIQQPLLRHYALLGQFWDGMILNYALGAAAALALFGGIVLLTKGRGMGMGDVKLAGALGLLFGWPDILLVIMLAFLVGMVVTLPLLFRRKRSLKDAVPFGPFLAAGAVLTLFFGYAIVKGYFDLFSI